jgi:hypothetical protein
LPVPLIPESIIWVAEHLYAGYNLSMRLVILTLLALAVCLHPAFSRTVLLERSSAGWRYDDDGKAAEGWQGVGFDDAQWKQGSAPLGYGDRGLSTTVGFGGDPDAKHAATFFRRPFEVPAGFMFARVNLSVRCDDGAALTLNGKQLARFNLGRGKVTAQTYADEALSGEEEQEFRRLEVPVELLREGTNVIAVSVHQVGPSSSDLVIDLEIVGLTEEDLPKKAVVRAAARPVINAYHKGHFVSPGMRIPDGYADGGTYMKIKEDGTVVATREVIMVDRERDRKLAGHIKFARSKRELPEVERAQVLARYIDKITSPGGDRDLAEAATRKLMDFRNSEILLGEIPAYCGGGVCRHRSLLFKIMGDEAGLRVGLRRGHMKSRGRILGRHAWNEITLENGGRRIVDVMNPEKNFKLPVAGKVSSRYAGIKGEDLYREKAPEAVD